MQGIESGQPFSSNEPGRTAALRARVVELEASIKEAGILELFETPQMISLRLPGRTHPVACTFCARPEGHRWIVLDLQIGGLSSRALALAGHTTFSEADIVGTTITFEPLVKFDDSGVLLTVEDREMLEAVYRERESYRESVGRHPGKAPHALGAEELELVSFAWQGILAAFHAASLSPSDVWEHPRMIQEISVEGTAEGLIRGESAKATWQHIAFDPIQMAPFPAARMDRSHRKKPLRKQHGWILHLISTNISMQGTLDTVEALFALDARTGDIVWQDSPTENTADSMGEALGRIIEEVGYRPGSAITTSPRLDDMLGEALQGLGVHYVRRKRLKASDSRVQKVEEFMRWAQPNIMADMMADGAILHRRLE